MITSPDWAGKRYAVLGLARSGAASVRALLAAGASVVGWDDNEASSEKLFAALKRDREHLQTEAGFVLKNWTLAADLTQFDALVVSPGVPLNRHPIAAKARAAGVPVIGDIELFAQARSNLPPHKVVGVTGTNGKSTTVSLIHHILQTAGVPSRLGGNIGLPILEQEPLPEGGVYVLELSSYQIDLTQTLDCDVAVLLNITPDHLDRYDGFEAYCNSKLRLFQMQDQQKSRLAVLCEPWPVRAEFDDAIPNWSIWWTAKDDHSVEQTRWPALKGPHNHENASAAFAVCRELGIDTEVIYEGMRTFPGLPHRMERVATHNGIAFINDSKATNPDSTAPALAAFERVHWILGGQSKTDDLDACAPHFGHVVRAYTIGEGAAKFAHLLDGLVPVEQSGTLAVAVASAAANARPGDTVLLSPACASFDQFRDFEDRGEQFRALVEALA